MFTKAHKTMIQILCLVFAAALTGCSSVGGLTGGMLGSSTSSPAPAHTGAAVATLEGVILAVKPIKVDVDSNGIVQSAIDSAGSQSAGYASSAIRSTTGYGGMMGVFGGIATKVAGKAVDMVADKVADTQAEDGVLISVKLDAGPTIPIKQAGDASRFHVGDRVIVEQRQDGSVSVSSI